MFDWIAFDADDTLWKNEEYYLQGRDLFLRILEKYDIDDFDLELVDNLEVKNIQYYGYGVMSFVLSLIELAIKLTQNRIHANDIQKLLVHAKEMLSVEMELYPGVVPLLETLSSKYRLMLITKGDLYHQQRKLSGSGLGQYFHSVEVVSEKETEVYQEILDRYQAVPERFLMIGNSLRSDVLPILDLGAKAIHLTGHLTWSHEDDPLSELPKDRFLGVERIDQVLSAIDQLTTEGRGE
jgi:putative hydrolase of the HAD superfamily